MEQARARLPFTARVPSIPFVQAYLEIVRHVPHIPALRARTRARHGRGHKEDQDVLIRYAGLCYSFVMFD
jgi:hypothetical protein